MKHKSTIIWLVLLLLVTLGIASTGKSPKPLEPEPSEVALIKRLLLQGEAGTAIQDLERVVGLGAWGQLLTHPYDEQATLHFGGLSLVPIF